MSAGSLIGPISISGSNTNTGTPNAGGFLYAYVVGTTTPTTIYSDAAATVAVVQPVTLDNAGRVPYATYPNGLYCTGPIRLYIVASDNTTVLSDTVYQTAAGGAALANADFPNESTVDAAFAAIGTSVGGPDGKYQAPTGTASRTIQAVISGIQLTPQDFGAKGDGIHDDTSAIQAAVNAVVAAGGGVVYFSPGTYKISSTIAIPSAAAGVSFIGSGRLSTVIAPSTSADVFSSTSVFGIIVAKMTINGSWALSGCNDVVVDNVVTLLPGSGAYGVTLSGCSTVLWKNSSITATSGTSGLVLASTSGVTLIGSLIDGGTNSIQFSGNSSNFAAYNCQTFGNVAWVAGYSGTHLAFSDCPSMTVDTTNINASDPGVTFRNCDLGFRLMDTLATGTPVTPSTIYETTELRVTNNSGAGGSMTVNPPTPAGSANVKGKRFRTYHVNASGGGVTWVFPASAGDYLTATFPPTGNGTTFFMDWLWDGANWNLCASGQAV